MELEICLPGSPLILSVVVILGDIGEFVNGIHIYNNLSIIHNFLLLNFHRVRL